MGTKNSSTNTRSRAKQLSAKLGAFHIDMDIDEAIQAHELLIQKALNFSPRYAVEGGSRSENASGRRANFSFDADIDQLAKQNIQARNRKSP